MSHKDFKGHTTDARLPSFLQQCEADCTCIGEAVRAEGGVGKVEGLAAAVAALTPVVLGGAGLGLYKMLTADKSGVTPAMPDGGPTDLPK
ncbi:hypothetical protein ACOMHN_039278 [Nucella lapillus]